MFCFLTDNHLAYWQGLEVRITLCIGKNPIQGVIAYPLLWGKSCCQDKLRSLRILPPSDQLISFVVFLPLLSGIKYGSSSQLAYELESDFGLMEKHLSAVTSPLRTTAILGYFLPLRAQRKVKKLSRFAATEGLC